jgi:hypothetical protein
MSLVIGPGRRILTPREYAVLYRSYPTQGNTFFPRKVLAAVNFFMYAATYRGLNATVHLKNTPSLSMGCPKKGLSTGILNF